jgi:RNA polymerase sigma-70 factor (ECF subfamily)
MFRLFEKVGGRGLRPERANGFPSRLRIVPLRDTLQRMEPLTLSTGERTDEALLLQRLRAGDEAAFDTLVRTFAPRLLAVARRILDNEEDAREAVQDAFLSAFRGLDTFSGEARLGTWLHRITVNAALMKLRRKQRRAEPRIDDFLPDFLPDGHLARPGRTWKETGEDVLQRRETRDLVRQAIARLPERYRTVLLLRDIEELPTEEVARLLGVTTNVVKVRLHRARQALRTLLDESFGEEQP